MLVCESNTFLSLLGQFWTTVAAGILGLDIHISSGGISPSICGQHTIDLLEGSGATVHRVDESGERFQVAYGWEKDENLELWSKHYSNAIQPGHGFTTVVMAESKDTVHYTIEGSDAQFRLVYSHADKARTQKSGVTTYDDINMCIAGDLSWLIAHIVRMS
ncbi:hypothetical protein WDZ92_04270 [Nostoc sp. NIES-2111]